MLILDNKKFPWGWLLGLALFLVLMTAIWALKPSRVMDIKRNPRSLSKPVLAERSADAALKSVDWEPDADAAEKGGKFVDSVIFVGDVDEEECLFENDVISLAIAGKQRQAAAIVHFREPVDMTANTLVFKSAVSRPLQFCMSFTDAERRTMGADEAVTVHVEGDNRTVAVSGRDIKSFSIDKARVVSCKISFAPVTGETLPRNAYITIRDVRKESDKEFVLDFS